MNRYEIANLCSEVFEVFTQELDRFQSKKGKLRDDEILHLFMENLLLNLETYGVIKVEPFPGENAKFH
jgi:hypothetical protein